MSTVSKQPWFLDVQGQARGPAAIGEIIRDLLDGNLQVTDRVSRDGTNWVEIDEAPEIEKAILALLGAMKKEATKVSPEQAASDSSLATQLQEINFAIASLDMLLAKIAAKKNAEAPSIANADGEHAGAAESELRLQPVDEPAIEAKASSRLLQKFRELDPRARRKAVLAIIAVVVAAFGTVKYRELEERRQEERFAEQARLAVDAARVGEYDKAIQIFHDVHDHSKLDPNVLLEMAKAHIEKKNYGEGKSLLRSYLQSASSEIERAKAHAMLGLVATRENDSAAAISSYEEALKEQSTFSVLHNLGVVYLIRGEYEKAEAVLLKALDFQEGEKEPTALGLFEAAYYLEQGDKTLSTGAKGFPRLERVRDILTRLQLRASAYAPELSVAQIVISSKTGDTMALRQQVARFIDLDETTLPPKTFDGDVDVQRSSWNFAFAWCRDLYKQTPNNDMASAFFAVCVKKTNGSISALPYAQYARQLNPSDQWIAGLLAHLLWSTDKVKDAREVLEPLSAETIETSRLASLTKREICSSAGSTGGALCGGQQIPAKGSRPSKIKAKVQKSRARPSNAKVFRKKRAK